MAEKKSRAKAKKELLAPSTIGLDPEVIAQTAALAPNPRTARAVDVISFWARQGLSIPAIAAKCGMDDITFMTKLDAIDEDGSRPFRMAFNKARAELEADLRVKLNHIAATSDSEKTKVTILRDQLMEIQRDNQLRVQPTAPEASVDFDYEDVEFISRDQTDGDTEN